MIFTCYLLVFSILFAFLLCPFVGLIFLLHFENLLFIIRSDFLPKVFCLSIWKCSKTLVTARFAIPYHTGISIWARCRYGTVYRAVHSGVMSTVALLRCYSILGPVTDGPRTNNRSDQYVPPIPGGIIQN